MASNFFDFNFFFQFPAIIFFEKKNPNVYEGDLMDEDEILQWLLSHLENDEIEDVDEDTLERMVKEGKTLAVLFCKLTKLTSSICNKNLF